MRTSLILICLTASAAQSTTWRFVSPDEIANSANVANARATDGLFRGTTNWDPYIYLRLPAEGIDGRALTRLTLRLYSSGPADHVAVYYKCDDGRWALGRSHPVVAGLAEYRIDLTDLRYAGDVSPAEGSRQGGDLRTDHQFPDRSRQPGRALGCLGRGAFGAGGPASSPRRRC